MGHVEEAELEWAVELIHRSGATRIGKEDVRCELRRVTCLRWRRGSLLGHTQKAIMEGDLKSVLFAQDADHVRQLDVAAATLVVEGRARVDACRFVTGDGRGACGDVTLDVSSARCDRKHVVLTVAMRARFNGEPAPPEHPAKPPDGLCVYAMGPREGGDWSQPESLVYLATYTDVKRFLGVSRDVVRAPCWPNPGDASVHDHAPGQTGDSLYLRRRRADTNTTFEVYRACFLQTKHACFVYEADKKRLGNFDDHTILKIVADLIPFGLALDIFDQNIVDDCAPKFFTPPAITIPAANDLFQQFLTDPPPPPPPPQRQNFTISPIPVSRNVFSRPIATSAGRMHSAPAAPPNPGFSMMTAHINNPSLSPVAPSMGRDLWLGAGRAEPLSPLAPPPPVQHDPPPVPAALLYS